MSTNDETQFELASTSALIIRPANPRDASSIWEFVQHDASLDSNSCYAYLLLCSDFADTCLVAHVGEKLVAFVVGYIPPNRRDSLFVWQVGVAREARGRGLARRLLKQLLHHAGPKGVRYLEATITPGNQPSWRLFQSLADSLGCELTTSDRFSADDFGAEEHEAEQFIRIGPIKE